VKVAILCRMNCWKTVDTIEYFRERGAEVSLVIIETAQRHRFCDRILSFYKAHEEFHRYLYPPSIYRQYLTSLWHLTPGKVRTMVKKTVRYSGKNPIELEQFLNQMAVPYSLVDRHSSWETRLILEQNGISYALLTSSTWLIKEPLLSMSGTRIINVHNAKLPEHRGLDALSWSVLNSDRIGLTAHYVDKGIDTGPILLFIEVAPERGDNLHILSRRVCSRVPEINYRVIQGLKDGSIEPVEQKESDGTLHRPMTVPELKRAERALQERLRQM
jgi:folate-dependent phosphoribosylglycinamide formyltransferase PurN